MSTPTTSPRLISGLGDDSYGSHSASLPVLQLARETYAHTQDCVRCGLCLPKCPTYQVTGDEAESPRGRISLMKGLADGHINASPEVRSHLEHCLDCRACETACPSGVVYHELIEAARCKLPHQSKPGTVQAAQQALIRHVLPHKHRVAIAMWPARIAQAIGLWDYLIHGRLHTWLPGPLRRLARLIPSGLGVWPRSLSPLYRASVKAPSKRATVAFLEGCAAGVLFSDLNLKTIHLLNHVGYDVTVPANQSCCGALALHRGDEHAARHFARQNIDTFTKHDTCGIVVTNSAGCGAMIKQYARLLQDDDAYSHRASQVSAAVRDISEVLCETDLPTPPNRIERTIAYHDPCHHAHAQRLTAAPRMLLNTVPGLQMVPLTNSDTCCGAAGTYNITQPDLADQLARRKLKYLSQSGADAYVTSNAGCMMHLKAQAQQEAIDIPFFHTVELLHEAYLGQASR